MGRQFLGVGRGSFSKLDRYIKANRCPICGHKLRFGGVDRNIVCPSCKKEQNEISSNI